MQDGSALVVPPSTSPSERIRLARLVSKRSVSDMATALGMSKGTYERVESGSRPARRGELIAIAQITGQDLAFFGASSVEEEDGVLPRPDAEFNDEVGAR